MILKYRTSSGAKIPIQIEVKRVSPDKVIKHQTFDKKERDNWCKSGGLSCAKWGCRPCCPPKTKLFSELKERKYMYLVMVKIVLNDYYDVYPNVKNSKSWCYFGMDGTHKMTRNVQNKISTSFEGQAFRVGGCLGCQYPKTGKCKRFAPALEATGINVVSLTEEIFGESIVWREAKEPMTYMIAVGGIYTDEEISKQQFKEVIFNVCGKQD